MRLKDDAQSSTEEEVDSVQPLTAWEDLMAHFHDACPDTFTVDDHTDLQGVVRVWQIHYHGLFFPAAQVTPPCAACGSACPEGTTSQYIPEDVDNLPLLLQFLCHAARALDSGGESPAALESAEEMRALVLYLSRFHLRYFIGHRLLQQRGALVDDKGGMSTVVRTATDPPSAEAMDATAGDSLDNDERRYALLSLMPECVPDSRDKEKIKQLVNPLSTEELLRAVIGVETVQSILECARPSRRVRCELYLVLLSALGGCEQLSSSTLASLLTCLAQCAESYATEQHIHQRKCHGSDLGWHPNINGGGDTEELRRLLQRFYHHSCSQTDSWSISRSTEEVEEADALAECGATSAASPYTLVSHLHVVGRVMLKRMNDAVFHEMLDECEGEDEVGSRMRQARRAEEGRLALMSLKDRKEALRRRQVVGHCIHSKRKTIGTVPSARKSRGPDAKFCDLETDVNDIALTDVAELCSAMAALRYPDDFFWQSSARYVIWCIDRYHQASTAGEMLQAACGSTISSDATFLCEVRHVLFALDFVGRTDSYTEVMKRLLRCGFLQDYIAPPSAHRHAMHTVKGTSVTQPLPGTVDK